MGGSLLRPLCLRGWEITGFISCLTHTVSGQFHQVALSDFGEADFLKFSGKRVSLKILCKKTGYIFVDRKLEKIGTKFHARSRRR